MTEIIGLITIIIIAIISALGIFWMIRDAKHDERNLEEWIKQQEEVIEAWNRRENDG